MKLNELEIGKSAVITEVGGEGALRQHFLDMGLIPGTEVTLMKYAPMGDPMELRVQDYELTLRVDDAKNIGIDPIDEISFVENEIKFNKAHPGLGEGGVYHVKADEHPVEKGTILTFALAGNQNSGKTTLFNQLTGSNQHVGNFPGVTVDRKDGPIKGHNDTSVVDLPGIYSLSPYTSEEIVSREYILDEKPKGIINIVDATNIERNLYLTLQLMELNVPMVLALNMMDEVKGNGGVIDINAMEEALGIPVVAISAAKNEGVDELVQHAIHVAYYQEHPGRVDFCKENSPVHRAIHGIMNLIEDHAKDANIPVRFAASKLVEGDRLVIDALKLTENEKEMIEHIVVQMEEECGLDRSAAVADMRFKFIKGLCSATVVKPRESKELIRSKKIDKILTGKWTAIPCFVLIMAFIFWCTFNSVGPYFQDLLDSWISALTGVVDVYLTNANVNPVLHGLIIDGIFAGVGSVLSFVPVIVLLFFFLSILEDSGYMARVAFFMDKILRKIGLSGRSIVPMLMGFGCSVPGVMSSRTLPSERDRKMTIMLIPFMSCSAKLPIYGFFAEIFFPDYAGLVTIALYLFSIIVGIILALVLKQTAFKGEAVPFVMELPNYRMPTVKSTSQLLWEKAKDFMQRAFTIILFSSIIIWAMQALDFRLNVVDDASQSIAAIITGLFEPIFKPLGFGDWRIVVALVTGILAKESVVSTLEVLFAGVELTSVLTPVAASGLLVFCLIYTPCAAAIAAINRELGGKMTVMIVTLQCVLAWVCALIVELLLGVIL